MVLFMKNFEKYKNKKILVAMSGGIDSSMTAVLLRKYGANVIGVHMRVWHYNNNCDLNCKIATCCSPEDAKDARKISEQFDFPFYSIDFQIDFRSSVIDPFINEYLSGRTPNPCVNCNSKMKLGTLLHKARSFGCDAVATGHYARINHYEDHSEISTAEDKNKDQTYYLFNLTQNQLKYFEMPLGEITKKDLRNIAREMDVHSADKPDSQEICFIPDNDYRKFIREETNIKNEDLEGKITDAKGNILGVHNGIHNFTIGQRKGLGINSSRSLYVTDLIVETKTVVVGKEEDVFSKGLTTSSWNWVSVLPTENEIRVRTRIRHHHNPASGTLKVENNVAKIIFDEFQKAITPGQAAVCYDDDNRVIGGGWINSKLN
jgi:tRNA-specific 2-thiouridylase